MEVKEVKKGEKIATIGMTGNAVNAGVNLSIEIDDNIFLFSR